MSLEELLDELRNGILRDQGDLVSGDTDQLWSDLRLIRYINEAERRMAREALLIRDGYTPEVTQIPLVTGQRFYALHPSVIAVISARYQTDTADLARAGHSVLGTYRMPDTLFFDPSYLNTINPGKVLAYDTDEGLVQNDAGNVQTMLLRVYPAPDATHLGIIRLRVVRMPLNKLRNLNDIPEIPEDHHIDMLDWAAYLALRIVDLDQGAPDRAAEFRQSFEAHVLEAKKIAQRKLFTPLQWGFGRNGFSWENN